jgi:hypothetical protein
MNCDDRLNCFYKLLQLRTAFKTLSQISWNISSLERRFHIDALSDKDVISLAAAYRQYIHELKEIVATLERIKDENEDPANKNME